MNTEKQMTELLEQIKEQTEIIEAGIEASNKREELRQELAKLAGRYSESMSERIIS